MHSFVILRRRCTRKGQNDEIDSRHHHVHSNKNMNIKNGTILLLLILFIFYILNLDEVVDRILGCAGSVYKNNNIGQ